MTSGWCVKYTHVRAYGMLHSRVQNASFPSRGFVVCVVQQVDLGRPMKSVKSSTCDDIDCSNQNHLKSDYDKPPPLESVYVFCMWVCFQSTPHQEMFIWGREIVNCDVITVRNLLDKLIRRGLFRIPSRKVLKDKKSNVFVLTNFYCVLFVLIILKSLTTHNIFCLLKFMALDMSSA